MGEKNARAINDTLDYIFKEYHFAKLRLSDVSYEISSPAYTIQEQHQYDAYEKGLNHLITKKAYYDAFVQYVDYAIMALSSEDREIIEAVYIHQDFHDYAGYAKSTFYRRKKNANQHLYELLFR